jgi:hypothetical protein
MSEPIFRAFLKDKFEIIYNFNKTTTPPQTGYMTEDPIEHDWRELNDDERDEWVTLVALLDSNPTFDDLGNLHVRGTYNDPEHYLLEIWKEKEGSVFFQKNEVDVGKYQWTLTYCSLPGVYPTQKYSTVLYGNVEGSTLVIKDGIWWPVNGSDNKRTPYKLLSLSGLTANATPELRFLGQSANTKGYIEFSKQDGVFLDNRGGFATGDPYITTLSGITYKMADFTGFSRMLQGTLENKPFTLNTETTLLTKEELTELAIERNKLFGEVTEGYEVDEFPAYFSKLHASWGEDSVTIDLKDFKVIQSTTNEMYDIESGTGKQYNWSTKETEEEKMLIPFGPVTLVVKNIPNPDVRNGFTILGSSHITDKVGALVKPMYVKDIKLKSLTSTKLIKDVKERTPKKIIQQEFRVKGGEKTIKDIPIY